MLVGIYQVLCNHWPLVLRTFSLIPDIPEKLNVEVV